jgi:ABC-type thiamine transport system ATPase subunit
LLLFFGGKQKKNDFVHLSLTVNILFGIIPSPRLSTSGKIKSSERIYSQKAPNHS